MSFRAKRELSGGWLLIIAAVCVTWYAQDHKWPKDIPNKDSDPAGYEAWRITNMRRQMEIACTPRPPACDFESVAERCLWAALQRLPETRLHYQQRVTRGSNPEYDYRADFAYFDAVRGLRIDVEVDGMFKDGDPTEQNKIARRDAWFLSHGWHVLRFHADDCYSDAESCASSIDAYVRKATRQHEIALRALGFGLGPQPSAAEWDSPAKSDTISSLPRSPSRPRTTRPSASTPRPRPATRSDSALALGGQAFGPGDAVHHPVFGRGVVRQVRQMSSAHSIIDVEFEGAVGLKKLDTDRF